MFSLHQLGLKNVTGLKPQLISLKNGAFRILFYHREVPWRDLYALFNEEDPGIKEKSVRMP